MANKRFGVKKRSYSDWRIDIDYWNKLNAEERKWLREFLKQFYQAQKDGPERRDIVTLNQTQEQTLLKPTQRIYYTQDDYKGQECLPSAPTPKTPPSE